MCDFYFLFLLLLLQLPLLGPFFSLSLSHLLLAFSVAAAVASVFAVRIESINVQLNPFTQT